MSYLQAMEPSVPDGGASEENTNLNITGGEVTLPPGYYYGSGGGAAISISGGLVHFQEGLYILDSGLSITGNAVVDVVDSEGVVAMVPGGAGVTFYSTNSDGGNWGTFFVAATAMVTFYAPSSGNY